MQRGNLAVATPAPTSIAPFPDEPLGADEQPWITLIHSMAQGDQEAMSTFYDNTKKLVYGLALRILKNPEHAEDVTLDVYVQVWKHAATYDTKRGRPSTWLCTLTRNRAIDTLRTVDRRTQNLAIFSREPKCRISESPEQSSTIDEQRRSLRLALATLPPPQRKALELAYFSGLTQHEIANRLGVPVGTVKSRVRSGLLKLRQLCEPLLT